MHAFDRKTDRQTDRKALAVPRAALHAVTRWKWLKCGAHVAIFWRRRVKRQDYKTDSWSWSSANVPPNALSVISVTGFQGSNDPTNSVKELKKKSHQVHPTVLTIIQQLCSIKQKHTKYAQINRNKSTHSEGDPLWQNLIQRTVITAHLSVLMTVHNFSTQYNWWLP